MSYSAIILSGGQAKRFRRNKSLALILGNPMISYVANAIRYLVDEILVITDTENNRKELEKILDPSVRIFLDEYNLRSPLVGASTGFKYAKGEYSLILACDTPLVSTKVLSLILELSQGYDAIIPKWPSGFIEPLQAAYNTKKAYEASIEAINHKELRMNNMITKLKNVLYISTIVLAEIQPELHTFLNINLPQDLIHIEKILKRT